MCALFRTKHYNDYFQETEAVWENLSATEEVLIRLHAFPIAIKGITRSCLGDIFEDENELQTLTEAYHTCWRTMEVCGLFITYVLD